MNECPSCGYMYVRRINPRNPHIDTDDDGKVLFRTDKARGYSCRKCGWKS